MQLYDVVSADMHLAIAVQTAGCFYSSAACKPYKIFLTVIKYFCAEVLIGLDREVICDTVF